MKKIIIMLMLVLGIGINNQAQAQQYMCYLGAGGGLNNGGFDFGMMASDFISVGVDVNFMNDISTSGEQLRSDEEGRNIINAAMVALEGRFNTSFDGIFNAYASAKIGGAWMSKYTPEEYGRSRTPGAFAIGAGVGAEVDLCIGFCIYAQADVIHLTSMRGTMDAGLIKFGPNLPLRASAGIRLHF